MRNAVADACFKVVPAKPRYRPRIPCSCHMTRVACNPDRKRFSFRASSISAVLMRSVGVTAVIEATTPAVIPASRFRPGDSVPVSLSAKACLIWSKKRNRTPSLPMEPWLYGSIFGSYLCFGESRKSRPEPISKYLHGRNEDADEAAKNVPLQAHRSLCTKLANPLSGRPASLPETGFVASGYLSRFAVALLSLQIQKGTVCAISALEKPPVFLRRVSYGGERFNAACYTACGQRH